MTPYASGERWELYEGDALDLLRTVPACSVDLVATDPPYSSGGHNPAAARNLITKSDREDEDWFLGDNMGADTYLWWMREIARETLRIATPGSQAQVFTDWRQFTNLVTRGFLSSLSFASPSGEKQVEECFQRLWLDITLPFSVSNPQTSHRFIYN